VRNKGQEVLLTDTVGFISKLPTDLIAAFRCVSLSYNSLHTYPCLFTSILQKQCTPFEVDRFVCIESAIFLSAFKSDFVLYSSSLL
jgi:hypothetical protein